MKNKQVICRVLALLLVVALLSGFAMPVLAAGTARITFGQACGKRGEQVTVPVTIEHNPGIASFRFRISYDTQALSFVAAEKAEVMTGGTLSVAYQEEKQELAITWFDVKNMTGDGEIFNLVFEIADEAEGVYPLEISYWPEDIVNATWQQVDCDVFDGCIQMGNKITGTVTSFGSTDDEVTVTLRQGNTEITRVVAVNGAYQFATIALGDYTLVVSKQNHVTRSYPLTVAGEEIVQDVKICLLGDVSGDGRVNIGDVAKLYSHICQTAILTDAYQLQCANVNGGSVNIGDAATLYSHCKGTKKLY